MLSDILMPPWWRCLHKAHRTDGQLRDRWCLPNDILEPAQNGIVFFLNGQWEMISNEVKRFTYWIAFARIKWVCVLNTPVIVSLCGLCPVAIFIDRPLWNARRCKTHAWRNSTKIIFSHEYIGQTLIYCLIELTHDYRNPVFWAMLPCSKHLCRY